MMLFTHRDIEGPFEYAPGRVYDLVIENPAFLYRFVSELRAYDEEKVFVSDEGNLLSCKDSYVIITDPFTADANTKKFLSVLYKKAAANSMTEERRQRLSLIQEEINELLTDFSCDFGFPMSFNDNLSLIELMAGFDFRVSANMERMETRMIALLNMIRETTKAKFVFIVGFLDMIEEQGMDAFLTDLAYLDLTLVNISSRPPTLRKRGIVTRVIDEDLCEY